MRKRLVWAASLVLMLMVGRLEAFEPHRSYSTQNKNANTTDAQTDAVLWTPTSGKAFALQGCSVSADATQTVLFEVGSTVIVPVVYLAANTGLAISGGYAPIHMSATDDVLTYTTTTSANTSVLCWGYEFQR